MFQTQRWPRYAAERKDGSRLTNCEGRCARAVPIARVKVPGEISYDVQGTGTSHTRPLGLDWWRFHYVCLYITQRNSWFLQCARALNIAGLCLAAEGRCDAILLVKNRLRTFITIACICFRP